MNRKEIIEFCNKNVFPLCKMENLHLNGMKDTVKLIRKWRIGKNSNVQMNPKVVDGFLYMNGDPIGRIASKTASGKFDDESYYWEGRCLAKAGL